MIPTLPDTEESCPISSPGKRRFGKHLDLCGENMLTVSSESLVAEHALIWPLISNRSKQEKKAPLLSLRPVKELNFREPVKMR